MPAGFFPKSVIDQSSAALSIIPKCGACGLYKTCKSPKMPVSGKGKKKILVIAEAPGKEEDERGVQLVGNSGKFLSDALRKLGVDMRQDCWLTNSVICRPPDNETPTSQQIDHCRPNLISVLDELKPEIIIPIGKSAVESLLGMSWKKGISSISQWVGWNIPYQKLNAWICPNYHPAYCLRAEDQKNPMPSKFFHRYLKEAVAHKGRPWEEVPDYEAEIDIILDTDEAAKILRKMIKKGGRIAFDYECNMLKPEWNKRRIVSASVCWEGVKTIAFPWEGEAIQAMKEVLLSDLQKIAGNMKFEERWTNQEFGHPVKNWIWCTVNNAHIIDCRPDITSVKFQGLVLLGVEPWNDHVEPYLKSNETGEANQILSEIALEDLLLYNGMDSLVEYRVYEVQKRLLNMD